MNPLYIQISAVLISLSAFRLSFSVSPPIHRLHSVKITQRKAENQIKMAKMIMMNELNKRANLLIEQLEVIISPLSFLLSLLLSFFFIVSLSLDRKSTRLNSSHL